MYVVKRQEKCGLDIFRAAEHLHRTSQLQLSNSHSTQKYKIRIIVNRNTSDPSFRKISNRYIFKLDPSNPQLKEKACFLVLLEKSKKEGSSN